MFLAFAGYIPGHVHYWTNVDVDVTRKAMC